MLIVLAAVATACSDDTFEGFTPGTYPEGEALLKLQLDFNAVGANGVAQSRALDGNAMDRLDDLCLVAYDSSGDLMDGFPIQISAADHNLKVTEEDRKPSDAANGQLAEDRTCHAEFDVRIPYGRYYLYALANLGKRRSDGSLQTDTRTALATDPGLSEAVKRRDDLLAYATPWDESNPMNNFQMLGFFSNGKAEKAPATGELTNDVMVDVNSPTVSLHSWLRRSCSKVTVDFDGSGLRENIYVYIRRATIHNLPVSCRLGRPNAARDESEVYSYKDRDYRPSGGDCIVYGEGDDHNSWPRVSRGAPQLLRGGAEYDWHGSDAESLFLYENMKGDSDNDKDNKLQKPDGDGFVLGSTDVEDNMRGASYIEVEGYYSCIQPGETSQGPIRYRFMLGEDALKNFDVERNRHIKLTMRLRGNGNDVDWHIEYEHDPGFEYKDPYYVSYLYNHESTLHFRYTPPEGVTVERIEAQIVANNWWPDDASAGYNRAEMEKQSPIKPSLWTGDVLNAEYGTLNVYTDTDTEKVEEGLRGKVKYLGNGWLSLRATTKLNLTYEETSSHGAYNSTTWQSWPDNQHMNDRYFYGVSEASNGIDRSYREYFFNKPDPENTGREAYSVEKNPDGSMRFNLPVFTRAKNLVKETGYSGNNIYEGSTRTAIVKVTLHLSNGEKPSQNLRVVQVPRLVNPKGIYRKAGNNENFHVVLTERDNPLSDNFVPVVSDGPWMAEVIGPDNFISLNGRKVIKGSTGSNIDFNVMFNKLNGGDQVRNAVIRIRYHNQTCVHLIFVRQGYGAQQIGPGGPEWHATNLIADGVDALDPRDEGSLFRFGNVGTPIDVASNKGYGFTPALLDPNSFKAPDLLYIAQSDRSMPADDGRKKWKDISASLSGGFGNSKIPTVEQIATMYNTENLSHGFGVLYADGATEVATTTAEAYGYYRHDAPAGRDRCGMRGVFMYYWDGKSNGGSSYNCRNIFFPIGIAGYGHRKAYDLLSYAPDKYSSEAGTLRYAAGRSSEMAASSIPFCPQFYDLYRRNGAIYWASGVGAITDVTGANMETAIALDLNYYTFDVNVISKSNVQKHSMWAGCDDDSHIDACFLRQVK
ncbi:MAG: hypothetical protein K2I56_02480 [Muribaculaceae bacterium]|nr:hypothetical protein [Muribaculaceae bacterium]